MDTPFDSYKKIVASLSKQYSSVFVVDFDTDQYDCLKVHPSVLALVEQFKTVSGGLDAFTRLAVAKEYRIPLRKVNDFATLKKRLATEEEVSLEFRSIAKGRAWCRVRWSALNVIDGVCKTALYTMEDISEEKHKDEQLNKQMHYIKGLISGFDMLLVCDIEKDTCLHTYYGKDIPEESQRPLDYEEPFSPNYTMSMRQFCHPDYLEQMLNYADCDYIRTVLRHKKRHAQRYLTSNPAGGYHWVELNIIKFADDDEIATEIAIAYTNVDAEEREKRAQRAALEEVNNIVHSTELGIWHTAQIMGRKPTLELDDKMRELLGIDEDKELTGEQIYEEWHKRVAPEDHEQIETGIQAMFSNEGKRVDISYKYLHPTKGTRYMRCIGFARPIMGGHMLSGLHFDATETVEKEKLQQKALEDALEGSKSKTVFLHNMVHEIRNPLNAIMGFSEILGTEGGTLTDDQREMFMAQIHNSYNILNLFIEDVLDIANSKHGNYVLNITETNVNNVCRNAMKTAEFRKPQNVKLYFTSEVNDDYTIQTDERRILQVLANYLSNACKHTSIGEIHLHCSTKEHPGRLTFSVTDTGEGVPPAFADNIFERFSKVNFNIEGTGLGLNICSVVAEKLHGEVYLDTTYTKGARFVFVL